ncbi:MAG: ATPase, partial [Lachnospiraceae bacterium]|nr:ATPase [Lachnospiraceae bacterium]
LYMYEEEGLTVEESLIEQYIRNDRVVKEFTAYYDLYNKYKKDYHIEAILKGNASPQNVQRAKDAAFDERLSLLGMLLDRLQTDIGEIMEKAEYLTGLRPLLKGIKEASAKGDVLKTASQLSMQAEGQQRLIDSKRAAGALSEAEGRKHKRIIAFLDECSAKLNLSAGAGEVDSFAIIKAGYDEEVLRLKAGVEETGAELHSLFVFAEQAFGAGNEMLILMTELTVNSQSAQFIAVFGSEDYKKHNSELMLSERSEDIKAQILEMEGYEAI